MGYLTWNDLAKAAHLLSYAFHGLLRSLLPVIHESFPLSPETEWLISQIFNKNNVVSYFQLEKYFYKLLVLHVNVLGV